MPGMRALSPADLDAIPRLGWVGEPTPITPLPRAAEALGLEWLGVKRDDLLDLPYGGAKPRKLDYVLAAPPFADAPVWSSSGGIGSGSLVALTVAAERLDRRLRAHMFWTPLSEGVTDNLAFTASGPSAIFFYGSRVSMAVCRPAVLLCARESGAPVLPPGATSPRGMIGTVRAGLELAQQIREGAVPTPDRVYVALGSGGTAVGLAVGLALGGVRTEVRAVAVVERLLALGPRIRGLEHAALAELARFGLPAPELPIALTVDHAHAGAAYAHPSVESIAAVDTIAPEGIHLEPVYTGKAMAALCADARAGGLRNVIFWSTVRRALPAPDPAWRDRLPPALRRRLEAPVAALVTRRRVFLGLAAAASVALVVRTTGYAPLPDLHLEVFSTWQARVLLAAAEAILPPDTDGALLAAIPGRIDRYFVGMPPKMKREAKAMLALIEHGTPIGCRLPRFTRLAPADRAAHLATLDARGGRLSQAARGLRDLVMLGFYQQPETWPAIGYDGPRLPRDYDPLGPARTSWPAYDALVARGHFPQAPDAENVALPKGVLR
ncbi:D-cysteine desulfhydrase [Minicystis rosea]|nr:D-cysteine desulfhydrase [Minicystis rosea]